MDRLFTAALAASIVWGLSAGGAAAADAGASQPVGEHKTMWESCATAGTQARERCMLEVKAKDSVAGRECDDLFSRAQRRCMLDILEGKRPAAAAK